MLTDFFFPQIDEIDADDIMFQQDGATCHTAGVTMELLREQFGESLISRNGPHNWPQRSCDLTPLDYFLWGYVKSRVYGNKPKTIDELEANIRTTIAANHQICCTESSKIDQIGSASAKRAAVAI